MTNKEEISPDNYANWFALYILSKNFKNTQSIKISSIEFGNILRVSQQTGSRRIQDLEKLGWIIREIEGKSQNIVITEKGTKVLFNMYKNLKQILEHILLVGEVTEGMKEGGYYVAIKGYYDQFKTKLGFEPYKGTLNLRLSETDNDILREKLKSISPVIIEGFKDQNREYGPVRCYDVYISRFDDKNNLRKAAILDIKRTHHKKNIIEILAKPYLREYFNLKDGDKIIIKLNEDNFLQ